LELWREMVYTKLAWRLDIGCYVTLCDFE